MPEVSRYAAVAGLATALLVTVGCSDSADGRMGVSGNVKFKGRPIPDGAIIQYEPLDSQGTAGQATITGGNYKIPRANGLKPGDYLVRMTAGDGKTAVNPVNPDEPPGPGGGTNIVSKDIVPPDWGLKSKQKVTVTAEGQNTFNFDIP
jgi:hypothetical protein